MNISIKLRSEVNLSFPKKRRFKFTDIDSICDVEIKSVFTRSLRLLSTAYDGESLQIVFKAHNVIVNLYAYEITNRLQLTFTQISKKRPTILQNKNG